MILKDVFKDNETFEREQTINYLMNLVFKQKKTESAILIFEEFKIKFEQEIAKRGIDSMIEQTTCEEYFDRKHKAIQKSKQLHND